MDDVIGQADAAIRAAWEGGLAGIPPLVEPLWLALIAGVFSFHMLRAACGVNGAVQGAIAGVLPLMLGLAFIDHVGDLTSISISSAGQIAALGGSDQTNTPLAIVRVGMEMFNRADDHAASQQGYLGLQFLALPQQLSLLAAGTALLLGYVMVSLAALGSWVELGVGVLVTAVTGAFMGVPGFGSFSAHAVSLMASSALRIAGLGILAAIATNLANQWILPPGNDAITMSQCFAAMGVAFVFAYLAWQSPRIVNGLMLGAGPGSFNMASSAYAAVSSAASTMTRAAGGASSFASASPSAGSVAGRMTGGGGGWSGGSGGSSGGGVSRRATPVNKDG